MVYSVKLLNRISLRKCFDHYTKSLIIIAYNRPIRSIVTKLIGFRESIVLFIYTKNISNLTK